VKTINLLRILTILNKDHHVDYQQVLWELMKENKMVYLQCIKDVSISVEAMRQFVTKV
jgi:hypothetical protein